MSLLEFLPDDPLALILSFLHWTDIHNLCHSSRRMKEKIRVYAFHSRFPLKDVFVSGNVPVILFRLNSMIPTSKQIKEIFSCQDQLTRSYFWSYLTGIPLTGIPLTKTQNSEMGISLKKVIKHISTLQYVCIGLMRNKDTLNIAKYTYQMLRNLQETYPDKFPPKFLEETLDKMLRSYGQYCLSKAGKNIICSTHGSILVNFLFNKVFSEFEILLVHEGKSLIYLHSRLCEGCIKDDNFDMLLFLEKLSKQQIDRNVFRYFYKHIPEPSKFMEEYIVKKGEHLFALEIIWKMDDEKLLFKYLNDVKNHGEPEKLFILLDKINSIFFLEKDLLKGCEPGDETHLALFKKIIQTLYPDDFSEGCHSFLLSQFDLDFYIDKRTPKTSLIKFFLDNYENFFEDIFQYDYNKDFTTVMSEILNQSSNLEKHLSVVMKYAFKYVSDDKINIIKEYFKTYRKSPGLILSILKTLMETNIDVFKSYTKEDLIELCFDLIKSFPKLKKIWEAIIREAECKVDTYTIKKKKKIIIFHSSSMKLEYYDIDEKHV